MKRAKNSRRALPLRISLYQILISSADVTIAGGVFYVLLPADSTVGFPSFLAVYLLAVVVAVITHVPGQFGERTLEVRHQSRETVSCDEHRRLHGLRGFAARRAEAVQGPVPHRAEQVRPRIEQHDERRLARLLRRVLREIGGGSQQRHREFL